MAYLTIRKQFTMNMAPGSLRYFILFSILVSIYHAYAYDQNYTLYKLITLTKRDRQLLYIIHKNFLESTFLNGITNEAAIPMNIAVENEHEDHFEKLLSNTDSLYTKYHHYSHFVPTEDWTDELYDDSFITYTFTDFQIIQRLYKYWKSKYPYIFKAIVIGKTYQQNDITILKVSGKTPGSGHKNPAVFILGGEQGRDWISPAIVLNYVKNLLEGSFGNWTQRFDAYFLPVLNPDGYYYTMRKDRFWAKNRTPLRRQLCPNKKAAIGVQIDQNWILRHRGDNPCSKMYFGEYLSEKETYSLSEFLDGLAPRALAFFIVKGFDNLITTPFAVSDKIQNNYDTMKEILQHTTREMNARYNKSYYYGTTRKFFFNYTGGCADWVKENLNVPVVATFYLKHEGNVVPDTSDIQPLSNEFSMGINIILSLTIDLYEPLFNSQWRHNNYHIVLLLVMDHIVINILSH